MDITGIIGLDQQQIYHTAPTQDIWDVDFMGKMTILLQYLTALGPVGYNEGLWYDNKRRKSFYFKSVYKRT